MLCNFGLTAKTIIVARLDSLYKVGNRNQEPRGYFIEPPLGGAGNNGEAELKGDIMTGPSDEPSIFNQSVLDNLRELWDPGEEDPVAELIELVLLDTPQQLEILYAALHADEREEAYRAVHSLHGSFRNLGVDGLIVLCADLQEKIKTEPLNHLLDDAQRLADEFQSLKPAMEAEMHRRSIGN